MSNETKINYWIEVLETSFDFAGINATKGQLEQIAQDIQTAHECYGMAYGYDNIPNPLEMKNKELQKKLNIECRKKVCPMCSGSGVEVFVGPGHTSTSQCYKCRGEGKVVD